MPTEACQQKLFPWMPLAQLLLAFISGFRPSENPLRVCLSLSEVVCINLSAWMTAVEIGFCPLFRLDPSIPE